MTNVPKLAIFDLDGTIATKGEVPASVLEGMKSLHTKGCITTVSTGRGYIRLKEVLGNGFDTIISPDALIILEHGTKIVNRNGTVVFGEYFSDREIDHIVDFTRSNIDLFRLVWFNPSDVSQKVQVCCLNEQDVAKESEKRGHYANVFHASLGELEEMLLKTKLTNVSLRLKEYVKVENLKLVFTRTETNVIFQDGNMEFIKSNINKGLAVSYVADKLGIDKADVLVAGNAINDVEMLDSGTGAAILVGPEDDRSTILEYLSNPETVITVDSPEKLGEYLSNNW